MSALRTLDLEGVISRAASALGRATGRATTLEDVQLISNAERRNLIARAVAVDAAGRRPVIIKATRSPPYDPSSDQALASSGLVREWVATALIARLAPDRPHGAALLAGDVAAGLLVFADLGATPSSLVDPLLHGSAAVAEQALVNYARALGQLHADTTACREAHRAAFRSIFGREPRASGESLADDVKSVTDRLGHAPPAAEIALLSERLDEPGLWLALVHGDPCPDNALQVDGGIRLIDYEFAGPAHALLDGLYWRMGFPTCWCAGRAPDDVADRVEAVYRAELARAVPLARDDAAYRVELAYVAAATLFMRFPWHIDRALAGDDNWGIAPVRARLLWYLEFVIALTAAAQALPGVHATATAWLAELRRCWPDAMPLGLYPAFASRTPPSS
jgi:hypothetical protein